MYIVQSVKTIKKPAFVFFVTFLSSAAACPEAYLFSASKPGLVYFLAKQSIMWNKTINLLFENP